MANTLKETIADKAITSLLELTIDSSKEELREIIDKNKKGKILYKTIALFSESSYFKKEYSNISYIDKKDLV